MERLRLHKVSTPSDLFREVYSREAVLSRPTTYVRRFSSSQVLIEKINLYARLDGHEGCVNTVEFNSTGDLLVSGSDDRQVKLWNWMTKDQYLSYTSGHLDNIFQAKIMPFTDDRIILTSSADGEVRVGHILEDGQVDIECLGNHHGAVHKLTVEAGSPSIFYSCGRDGSVLRYDLRNSSATKILSCSSVLENRRQHANSVRLNAMAIDPRNPNYFAVGGSNQYARVYDSRSCQQGASSSSNKPVNMFCPSCLTEVENVLITGLAYSNASELLISYNDELVYLFQKNMGRHNFSSTLPHDAQTLEEPQVYMGHRNAQTVKGASFFGPNDEYVTSGSDCGHIFIWEKKGAKLVRSMVGDQRIVNQVEPHPHMPFLASSGIEHAIKVWVPMASDDPPLPYNIDEITEANRQGREDSSRATLSPDVIMHVLRLQRRQTSVYVERQYSSADVESDDEALEALVLGLIASDETTEEANTSTATDNETECKII